MRTSGNKIRRDGVRVQTRGCHKRPKLLIIYTGGTIGMMENPETGALEPFNFEHLLENVPKIRLLDLEIESVEFENPIDSSSMNPRHWQEIARVIEDNYAVYDGFVVLHGTDTMAYTASALSFMLENLDKPGLIFVAEHLMLTAGSADWMRRTSRGDLPVLVTVTVRVSLPDSGLTEPKSTEVSERRA